MDVNDNVGCLTPSGVLEFIASRLAPTGGVRIGQKEGACCLRFH
jgi:hypothetical protein